MERPFSAADVEVLARRRRHDGFFAVDELTLTHPRHAGGRMGPLTREVFVSGDAVVVLPWEPQRDLVLVIEQFRVGPFARGDASPWLTETIAGRIDPGETPANTAVREAREEAGLALDPAALVPGPHHYPSPGMLDEYLWLYVAMTALPDDLAVFGGLDAEHEDIRVRLLPRAELTAMARGGRLANGPLALLTLWLEGEAARLAAGAARR